MTNYAQALEHCQQETHTNRRMRLQSNLKQSIPIINIILLSFYECVDPILNSPSTYMTQLVFGIIFVFDYTHTYKLTHTQTLPKKPLVQSVCDKE